MKDKVEALDQALLTAEMFVAFSKKSPCALWLTSSARASPS